MWRRFSVAATLVVLSGCQTFGEQSPVSCGPAPMVGSSLWGAFAISASDIWAVGGYQDPGGSGPLTVHWDGQRWTAIEAPVGPWDKGAGLYAVSAASPRDVWAVGEGHKNGQNGTLIEHSAGSSWSVVNSPNPSPTDNQLTAVDVISDNDVWATGYYFGPTGNRPLIEHWNGAAWSLVDSPGPAAGNYVLSDVSAVDGTDAWVVGYQRESDNARPRTLIEHWDGLAWHVVSSPNSGTSGELSRVRAVSADDVWAVGGHDSGGAPAPLIEHWDGVSWAVMPSPNSSNVSVQAIAATGPADVWIGGAATRDWLIQHWDGNRWTRTHAAANSTGVVNAVTALPGSVWAVGNHYVGSCGPTWALIERWDGKSWSYVHSPHDGPDS